MDDNYVEILNSLITAEWGETIIVDANGKEAPKYVRYDPIRRRKIYRDKPPVKMTRTSKSTNGETKTTVKKLSVGEGV